MREGSLTTVGVVTLAAAALFIAPSWVSDLGPGTIRSTTPSAARSRPTDSLPSLDLSLIHI